ncbi:hypothetical protein H5968_09550 [Sphaerospermopsis sp. LEGE 00249]|nr:hypothetical protein [Sphaerospermopsis sp. LEGE 00249]MBC5795388.1 hypothetical protein [Sphaerospermopsis sp. LEGE 00249]
MRFYLVYLLEILGDSWVRWRSLTVGIAFLQRREHPNFEQITAATPKNR